MKNQTIDDSLAYSGTYKFQEQSNFLNDQSTAIEYDNLSLDEISNQIQL